MRPGASRLCLAASVALLAAALTQTASAAPLRGGAGPARAGHPSGLAGHGNIVRPPHDGGFGARFRAGRPFGFRAVGFPHGGGRFGHRHRHGFGYGYGGWLGLPIGYGYGVWDDRLAGYSGEPEPAPKPEWPTMIGIPPSPVAPPAIYVIGSSRRAAAASARRSAAVPSVSRGSAQVASAPRFIRVPARR